MNTNHLTMILAALSLTVSPLATLPASAQQNTQKSGQAQTGSQSDMQSGSQSSSGTTGSDCTPDASGACPQGKGQLKQKSDQGSKTQKSAKQPSNDNGTTSGSASGKSSTETKPGSQDASGGTTTEQKPTTKAGTTDSSGTTTSGSTTQSGDATKQSNQNSSTTNTTETNVKNNTTNEQTSSTKSDVNITVEQQTELRKVVKEVHVAPIKETDFTVSVGTKIPKKIRLQPLPPRIVKIVPAYEGYRFFLLADGRIVIVDPNTLAIVYIIEA
ncbi:hypothetical protein ATY81_22175 [Rhizobium sp. R72]|uniref:DUF1236 domain-containing protein n=1 Tax=unclassified Rhizobium TaxID=2613769 RepID=UPI000B5328FA|nr:MULTISPECIES: DUF1236 domain-containing protein [unclassified Rhizobium]OWW02352.1 hypothetical protein ATY81_22175 [Rhizobium sp. R72]OWW02486.1 hypothetical protein ATY80_22175 [Rhizobium sp. R711]